VKSTIWAGSLGSGTSGGVLAPLLMMGGALGGLESLAFPDFGIGFWPLVSMGAILAGAMRCPLTGIIFALELTHDFSMAVPLVVAATIAHAVTVLVLKRSILTEKISRRGYHLSREYEIDALEIIFVREAMRTHIVALPADASAEDIRRIRAETPGDRRRQLLYPVVDAQNRLQGVVTRDRLERWAADPQGRRIGDLAARPALVAHPDEPLRAIAYRMAETGLTRLPVVERGAHPRLLGMISLGDLLKGRRHTLDAEHRRERVFSFGATLFVRNPPAPRETP
jgi:CBS domain-containing protein